MMFTIPVIIREHVPVIFLVYWPVCVLFDPFHSYTSSSLNSCMSGSGEARDFLLNTPTHFLRCASPPTDVVAWLETQKMLFRVFSNNIRVPPPTISLVSFFLWYYYCLVRHICQWRKAKKSDENKNVNGICLTPSNTTEADEEYTI